MDVIGIHQNGVIGGTTFSGYRGVKAFSGDPNPTVQIEADKTTALTTETVNLTAHTSKASYVEWQKSRNGTTWILVGDIAEEYSEQFPHDAAAIGNHYFRCVALNMVGESVSDVITVTVSPRPPQITVAAYPETVTAPGIAILSADIDEYTTGVQWQHSTDGEEWTDISGATGITHEVAFRETDTGTHYYRAIASGLDPVKTTSNTATITVEGA